jgi:organic radical activating enzyme
MPFVEQRTGRIESIKLEFNIVQHCNYACAECSHFSPHLAAGRADLDSFRRDLEALARVYHVGRFRFVGGEPFLHNELGVFVEAVRASGIAKLIEIVSNGSLLRRADDSLVAAIDSLSISAYDDPRLDETQLERVAALCRVHSTRLKLNRIDRFRQMQLERPISDERLLDGIFRSCQIAHSWYCQTFADGMFYLCSRPLFTDAYLELKEAPTRGFARLDGIPLHEPDLAGRLAVYLSREQPLESCRYCLGTVGRYEPWRQQSTAERRSSTPSNREADTAISTMRLRLLLGAARLERGALRLVPSLRLARAVGLLRTALLRA